MLNREKKEKFKADVRSGLTKVDTGLSVGLQRFGAGVEKYAKQRIISRRILKKNKMSVHIPEYKAPSVLGDPNRFFKNELANERRNMFFQ